MLKYMCHIILMSLICIQMSHNILFKLKSASLNISSSYSSTHTSSIQVNQYKSIQFLALSDDDSNQNHYHNQFHTE